MGFTGEQLGQDRAKRTWARAPVDIRRDGHGVVVSPVPDGALLTQLRADVDSLSTQLRRCDRPGIRVKDLDHSADRQMESWTDHVPGEVKEENPTPRGRAHVPVGKQRARHRPGEVQGDGVFYSDSPAASRASSLVE
jgi:hypothetical protein